MAAKEECLFSFVSSFFNRTAEHSFSSFAFTANPKKAKMVSEKKKVRGVGQDEANTIPSKNGNTHFMVID